MKMRIKSEVDILDPMVRKKIIDEIMDSENQLRKDKAYRAQQVFEDQTSRFVMEDLLKQFDQTTVHEMQYAISNISLVRKVISKLARVYSHGAEREISKDKTSTEKLESLSKELDFNSRMKDQNNLLKLHRNSVCYVKPCSFLDRDINLTWRVRISPLSPHLYDAVEGFWDRTQPLVYILSNYEQIDKRRVSVEPSKEGRTVNSALPPVKGDQSDQVIADTKEDENSDNEKKEFIWWSDTYHFTTNKVGAIVDEMVMPKANQGQVLDDPEIANPIEEMPFVNFAIGQQNSFWARGGDDLVDGGILVNSMISNMNHIAVTQGYGQLVLTGKNLPRNVLGGPSKAILLEYDKDEDPTPTYSFETANPDLGSLQSLVEMHVALLLTTNNLSTSGVSTQLNGQGTAASGIALLIDKSESQEDVQDQQQIFKDNEPDIWRKTSKWLALYQGLGNLDESLEDMILPEGFEDNFMLNFPKPQTIISEAEQLANLKARKDLGLNTMVELLKLDQEGLTDEQAEKKLLEITEEKAKRMAEFMTPQVNDGEDNEDKADGQVDNESGGLPFGRESAE